MGQLFRRIKQVIKSNLEDSDRFENADFSYFFDDDDKLKQEIENAFRNSQKSDSKTSKNRKLTLQEAYNILGIEPTANIDEVKRAYRKKVKEYHPDLVQNLGNDIKDLAQQKIKEINQAYELIQKEKGF
jgi:DnaJ-class molecular chaperone